MLRKNPDRPRVVQPPAVLRCLAGVVAALAAVGVGHGVAGLINPVASPILAVGSTLIDAAPTPAKEFAVKTFGTYDKPILIGSIGLALLVFAAVLGLIAWRHRRIALVGISLLGVVGIVTAVARGSVTDGIPSLVAGIVGVVALLVMTRSAAPAEDATTDPIELSPHSRRGFLLAMGGTAVLAAIGGGGGVLLGHVRAAGAAARRLIKLPTPVSGAKAIPAGAQLPGMTPFVTPVDAFYRVDIALVTPRVEVSTWSLTIDGMVDHPLTLTYADLLELPMIERDITLTCVSNEVGGPYVGTTRWLGVPFSEIIKRVGVQPGADQAYSYSSDSGYTCSTPIQALTDGRDAMIVVAMNGEPLPDAHGFPARMLVPGLFGFVSATKWLERIEFTTYAKRTAYWTERKWATDAPILTQSRIDVPKSLGTIPKNKSVIAGVAWAQHRGIDKVEIKIDDGDWKPAKLAASAGIDLWRQWSYAYDGPAGLHSAQVRATDLTGATQPERRTKVFPSGATGWNQIQFTSE
jgi:DMSO/TMAO reductase YedYZ molybdopterin-dependent catalytic subunit